jgi:hypothetical protein
MKETARMFASLTPSPSPRRRGETYYGKRVAIYRMPMRSPI